MDSYLWTQRSAVFTPTLRKIFQDECAGIFVAPTLATITARSTAEQIMSGTIEQDYVRTLEDHAIHWEISHPRFSAVAFILTHISTWVPPSLSVSPVRCATGPLPTCPLSRYVLQQARTHSLALSRTYQPYYAP